MWVVTYYGHNGLVPIPMYDDKVKKHRLMSALDLVYVNSFILLKLNVNYIKC